MSIPFRRIFLAVPDGIREWTNYLSKLLFARTFTATLLGCTTEPTGTARYTMSAGVVTLKLPELTATSNQTFAFISGLPEEITPQFDQVCLARIVDNGATAVGLVHIGSDTGITLYADIDEGAFTASGTKGIQSTTITYSLD